MATTQPLPFNTARLALTVQGEALDVITMTGTEALSSVFRFQVDALVGRFFEQGASIGTASQLTLTGVDGTSRIIAGIITEVIEQAPHSNGQLICQFIIESRLQLLSLKTDSQIILGHSLPGIVQTICERHGISTIKLDLSQQYPVYKYIVQTQETDLAFIQRLCGNAGITFWSSNDENQANQEVITFTDHNANCPYLARNVLQYKTPTSLVQEYNSREVHVGLHKMAVKVTQQTDHVNVHDWNENTPATKLYAGADVNDYGSSQGYANSSITRFGLGSRALDETAKLAKQHAEYARCQSWVLESHGNVIDMAAGFVFSLDANEFNPEHSGDLIITAVEHHASQAAGLNMDGVEVAYRSETFCIKRSTP